MTERDDGDDEIFDGESDELVRARAELKKLIRPVEDNFLWKHTVGERPAHLERIEGRQANAAARAPRLDAESSLDFLETPEFSVEHDGEWDASTTPSPAPRHSFFRPRLRRRARVSPRRVFIVAGMVIAAVAVFVMYRLLQRPIVPPPVVLLPAPKAPTPKAPRFEFVELRPVETPEERAGLRSLPRLPSVTPPAHVEVEPSPLPLPAPSAAKPSPPRREPPEGAPTNHADELPNPEIRP